MQKGQSKILNQTQIQITTRQMDKGRHWRHFLFSPQATLCLTTPLPMCESYTQLQKSKLVQNLYIKQILPRGTNNKGIIQIRYLVNFLVIMRKLTAAVRSS